MAASEDFLDLVRETLRKSYPAEPGGLERAMELVDDTIVRLLTAAGTPNDCRRKVAEYVAAGCSCPLLYPLGDDVRLMIDSFAEA